MEQIIRIGMDTSKHVFQLHGVNAAEQPILRKKLRRKEMMGFFRAMPADCDCDRLFSAHPLVRARRRASSLDALPAMLSGEGALLPSREQLN